MGKGDKKSRRGKVTNGSYGKTRMRKESTPLFEKSETAAADKKEDKKPVEKKKAPAKKIAEPKTTRAEKVEKVSKEEKLEHVEKVESADEKE